MKLVYLISGKAGAGKTTTANYMQKYLETHIAPFSSYVCNFAQALKAVCSIVGWDGEKDERGRKLLQDVGRVVRDYDEDTWVRAAYKRHIEKEDKPAIFLIDDWRFPNEYDWLYQESLSQGDFVVLTSKVYGRAYDLGAIANDISETALSYTRDYDYWIPNEGDLWTLESEATKWAYQIGETFKYANKVYF